MPSPRRRARAVSRGRAAASGGPEAGEAAAFLRLSPNALNWYRSQRRGPTYQRIGPKTIRYRVGDLRAYMVEVQPLSRSYESRTARRKLAEMATERASAEG